MVQWIKEDGISTHFAWIKNIYNKWEEYKNGIDCHYKWVKISVFYLCLKYCGSLSFVGYQYFVDFMDTGEQQIQILN